MFLPALNFKQTYPIDIGAVVNRAIAQQHGNEAAKKVAPGCMALQALRVELVGLTSAGRAGASQAAIALVLDYIKALDCVASKVNPTVPLSENFVWTDSLDSNQLMQQPYLTYERSAAICTLGNLEAALGYKAGMNAVYDTALTHFQRAAGYYHVLTSASPPPISTVTVDLSHDSLKCMEQAMLANAQMSFYRVASSRQMPIGTVAKLAAAASNLCSQTNTMTSSPALAKTPIPICIGGPCELLSMFFEAEANHSRSMACLSDHEMREPLARLYLAQTIVYSLQRKSPQILEKCDLDFRQQMIDNATTLASTLKKSMEGAVKDNEHIYRVKAMQNPQPLEQKVMVKASDLTEALAAEAPGQIHVSFSVLVPGGNSSAPMEYAAMIESYFDGHFGPLKAASTALKLVLQEMETASYSLAQVAPSTPARPTNSSKPDLIQQAVQSGGTDCLEKMAADLRVQADNACRELSVIERQLATEEADDTRLRPDPRVSSMRPPSSSVTSAYTTACRKSREDLAIAANSDAYGRGLLESSREILRKLPPSGSQVGGSPWGPGGHLREVLDDVKPTVAKAQGSLQESDLALQEFESIRQGDTLDLESLPSGNHAAYFDTRLRDKYGSLVEHSGQVRSRMSALERKLQDGLSVLKRQGDQAGDQSAEDQAAAAAKWAEVRKCFDDGLLFYNREREVLSRLAADVNHYCAMRRDELDNVFGRMNLGHQ